MELIFATLLLVLGLGVLIIGAEWLVKGASSIARGFGIPALVIGLTVVSFGTSAPELTVSLYAALTGSADLAIGNVVGSNIANILLILGISAVITPLAVQSSTVKWEIPLALLSSILVYVMGRDMLFDGASADLITRVDGVALVGFFVIFLFYVFALAKQDTEAQTEEHAEKAIAPVWSIGLVLVGLGALVLGGKVLVDNAVILARAIGLSETVIGLTVVAIGTSLPELATSVVAALKKEIDIAVGNIIGSNIFNVFWILGVTAVVTPLPVPAGFGVDALVMIAATLLLFLALFVGRRHQLDRWQGAVFIFVYIGYLAYLLA